MRSLLVLCSVMLFPRAAVLADDGDPCYIFPARVDPGKQNVKVIIANFANTDCSVLIENIGLDRISRATEAISARSLKGFNVPQQWTATGQGEIQMIMGASFGKGTIENTTLTGQIQLLHQPRVLVQLSHPLYSPGDQVRYRVLLTDGLISPLMRTDEPLTVTVALVHEAQHTVKSYHVPLYPSEIHSGLHPLTDDRDVGNWNITITVGDQTTTKPFQVVQSSAPVHQLTVEATSMNHTVLELTVKAFYTFGKPIKGKMTLTVSGGDYAVSPIQQPILGKTKVRIPMKRVLDATKDQPGVRTIDVSVTVDTENGVTHRTYHQTMAIPIHPEAHKLTLHRMVGFEAGRNATVLVKVVRFDGESLLGFHAVSGVVFYTDEDGLSHEHPSMINEMLRSDGTVVLSVPTQDDTTHVTFNVSYHSLETSFTLEAAYSPELFVRIIPVSNSGTDFVLGIAASHAVDGLIVVVRDHYGNTSAQGIVGNSHKNYYELKPQNIQFDISSVKSVHLFARANDVLVETSVYHEEPVLPQETQIENNVLTNGEHVVQVRHPGSGNQTVVGVAVYGGLLNGHLANANYIHRHLMFNGSHYEATDNLVAEYTSELFSTPSDKLESNDPHERVQPEKPSTRFNQLLLWQEGIISSPGQVALFKFKPPRHVHKLTVTAFTFSETDGLDVAVPLLWQRNLPVEIYLHVPYMARKLEPVAVDIYVVNNRNSLVEFVLVELLNTANEFTFQNNSGRIDATRKHLFGRLEPNEVQRAEFLIRPKKLGSIMLQAAAYMNEQKTVTAEAILRTVPESLLQTDSIMRPLSVDNSMVTFSNLRIPIPLTADGGSEKITVSLHHEQHRAASLSASLLLDKLIEADPFTMAVKAALTLDVLRLASMDWPERAQKASEMLAKSMQLIEGQAKEDGSFEIADVQQPSSGCLDTVIAVQALSYGNRHPAEGGVRENVISHGLNWLKSQQSSDGRFCAADTPSVGLRVEMAAHVLLAFSSSTAKAWQYVTVIDRARTFLQSTINDLEDPYHLALVGYALHLSAKHKSGTASEASIQNSIDQALRKLLEKKRDTATNTKRWWSSDSGRNLETTAYGLLLLTAHGLLFDAAPVVNWIKRQPYRHVPPVITADSHIALRALIAYAERTSFLRQEYTATVVAKSKRGTIYNATLNRESASHVLALPPSTRSVAFAIEGSISGAVEINYSYMENVATQASKFDVKIERYNTSTDDYVDWGMCVRFLPKGALEMTRLVSCEISFPTGFIALDDSVDALRELDVVTVILRNDESQLVVTFEEIGVDWRCFDVTGFRRTRASRVLPGTLKVFDVTDSSNVAFKNFNIQH